MRLNQEKIERMFNARGSMAGGGGGGSESIAGLASQVWTEENYVSKAFFNELFIIHKKTTTTVYDGDVVVSTTVDTSGVFSPNEVPSQTESTDAQTGYRTVVETEVDNIEAKKGLWTDYFLSALGLNSSGGGGGSDTLAGLLDVELDSPTANQVLTYYNGKWRNMSAPGVDMNAVWQALGDTTTTQQIAHSHLTTALNGYATQLWVGQQGFLTSADLSGYATQTWVTNNFSTPATVASQMQNYAYISNGAIHIGNASLTPITSVSGTFWGNSWTNGGTVTGSLTGVVQIDMTGHLVMHSGDTGIYLNSDGTGIDWHNAAGEYVSSLIAFTSAQVQINQDLYIPSPKIIRIGDAVLVWDGDNNALKLRHASGANASVNFYATGGVSALGSSDSGGGGGGGDVTWDLLANNSDTRPIALSHLTGALAGYATTSQLAGYLPLTGGTMTGQLQMNLTNTQNPFALFTSGSQLISYMRFKVAGTSNASLDFGWFKGSSWGVPDTGGAYMWSAITGAGLFVGASGIYYTDDGGDFDKYVVWSANNDGSGSGLDADLLDGQHGSYYAAAASLANYLPLTGGTLTSNTSPVLSLTSALEVVTLNMACSVNGSTTTRVSIGYDDDMAFLAIVAPGTIARIGVDINGQPQFRTTSSSSTASLIWTSGNDGAGSGMDADLLDGQHGSYYATASQLAGYLPLTAGSSYPLTGELFLNEGINVLNTYSTKGHFGKTSFSWLGGPFPTLYSLDGGGSAYMMITTPHIPFLQNGSRGYTGSSYGSIVRFEGGITESEYWDLGIPSSDTFKISRSGVELFRINSNGNVGVAHDNPLYKLHVAGTFCATSVAITGGTSSQFLKADGTTDANSYALTSSLSSYLPLTGGTISGSLIIDVNTMYPLKVKGSTSYSIIDFLKGNGQSAANVGWLNDSRGDFAYIFNNSSGGGAVSVNASGCYYSVDTGNTLSEYTIYHTGNISSASVASAATLTTSRTIWGQSFNGSSNITGAMSSVTNINSILYFDTTNNRIGVNTSSPSEALNINGGLYATAISYFSDNVYIRGGSGVWSSRLFVGTPSSDLVLLGYLSNNVHGATVGAHNGTLTAWAPLYLLGTSVNLGYMESIVATVASNLCFGIGTTSPSYKLHVAGTMYASNDVICDGNVTTTSIELNGRGTLSGYGGFIDFHYNGSSADYTSRIIEDASGRLYLSATNGVRIGDAVLRWESGNNALRIESPTGGAVNLYTTGGLSALGISGAVDGTVNASLIPSATGTYTLGNTNYRWKELYLASTNGSYNGRIYVDYDGINLDSANGGWFGGSRYMMEGRLVIGTQDDEQPNYDLYVAGNTYVDGTNAYFYGNVSVQSLTQRSDMRIKDVISDLTLKISTIAQAPLFKYKLKQGDGTIMVGSSAQYWDALLPEVIHRDAEGILGLDYGVTALASVISVAKEVTEHERRIARLEAENAILRAQIEDLKAA